MAVYMPDADTEDEPAAVLGYDEIWFLTAAEFSCSMYEWVSTHRKIVGPVQRIKRFRDGAMHEECLRTPEDTWCPEWTWFR